MLLVRLSGKPEAFRKGSGQAAITSTVEAAITAIADRRDTNTVVGRIIFERGYLEAYALRHPMPLDSRKLQNSK